MIPPDQHVEDSDPPDEIVLDVRDLIKWYPVRGRRPFRKQWVQAVNGVSFRLHRGETLGLVGESGCGKTTLAKLLMMLEIPTGGSAYLNGRDLYRTRARERRALRRDLQMVMQDPYASLNPKMAIEQIVGEPIDIHRSASSRGARKRRIQELLEVVGLNPEHLQRHPHQFSGGQRQRIGIARALALEPAVIICDEPVSALDVSIQAQVLNLLSDLQSQFGLSYIFIAHDLSVVRHIADRIAVMYLGRIAEIGRAEQVYSDPRHPYTQALVSAVPDPDPRGRGEVRRIPLSGEVPSPINPPSGCTFRTRCWRRNLIEAQHGSEAAEICGTLPPPLEMAAGHYAACHFADRLGSNAALSSAIVPTHIAGKETT